MPQPSRRAGGVMLITCDRLRDTPRVFRSMTGLTVAEFDALLAAVLPRLGAAERARQERAGRRRAPGAGHPHGLPPRDRVLLTVIWLRHDLARDVLGCLFGVSGTTAARVVARILPLLVGTPADPKRGRSASLISEASTFLRLLQVCVLPRGGRPGCRRPPGSYAS